MYFNMSVYNIILNNNSRNYYFLILTSFFECFLRYCFIFNITFCLLMFFPLVYFLVFFLFLNAIMKFKTHLINEKQSNEIISFKYCKPFIKSSQSFGLNFK